MNLLWSTLFNNINYIYIHCVFSKLWFFRNLIAFHVAMNVPCHDLRTTRPRFDISISLTLLNCFQMHYLAHWLSTFIQIPIISNFRSFIGGLFHCYEVCNPSIFKNRSKRQHGLTSDDFQIVAVTMVTSIYKVFIRILICW